MASKTSPNWIPEKEAVALLLEKSHKQLRAKVKAREIPINVSVLSAQKWLYSKTSIEEYINSKALY